jgi:glucose/arabinose dehydrogenase
MARSRPLSRPALATLTALATLGMVDAAHAQEVHPTQLHDYRLETVAEGLVNPWGLAFLPNGDLLVTERPGRLRIVSGGELSDPVSGVPEVFARGQGGLLDVELHPDFASNRMIYLSYSRPLGEDASTTAVVRGRLEGTALTGVEEIFEAVSRGRGHYGSRIQFDGQGHVFISVGERQAPARGDLEAHPAQDLTNHHGVVVRLNDDGTVPADNPFVGRDDALPEIWSYGHRNQQGLVYDPETGNLWATEHGPQGGDELNLIRPGLNYGWPVVGYGVNYGSGTAIHEGTMREGMEDPRHIWVPSIATSGLVMYTGDAFPGWRGDIFSGGLSGEVLVRLDMDGEEVVMEEIILHDMGRIRDVEQGPDGALYIALDSRRGGETPILKLVPAS